MTSNPLDEIQARHEKVDATYKSRCSCCTTPASHVDRGKLVAALRAVEDWCEANQHPTTDYPEGFSRQDYALDDAARRIRQAIQQALDA